MGSAPAPAPVSSDLIDSADLRPINDVCRARLGRKVGPSTVWRWVLKGVKVRDERIKLSAVRVAGIWHTSHEAFAAFLREQTAAALAGSDDGPAGERDAETTARLKAAGVL